MRESSLNSPVVQDLRSTSIASWSGFRSGSSAEDESVVFRVGQKAVQIRQIFLRRLNSRN